MLALRLPYVLRTNIREGHHEHVGGVALNTVDARGDSQGIGDAVLLAQGRFLNNVMTGTQAAFLIGVKAPTGATNRHDAQGLLFEAEFQPGSGSWDGLFGLAMTQRFGAWSLDGNVLYQLTSTGTQDTNLGSRILFNAAVSYRVVGATGDPRAAFAHAGHEHKRSAKHDHTNGTAHTHVEAPSWVVDLVLELNGERHEMQTIAGVQDINRRHDRSALPRDTGVVRLSFGFCLSRASGGEPGERSAIEDRIPRHIGLVCVVLSVPVHGTSPEQMLFGPGRHMSCSFVCGSWQIRKSNNNKSLGDL
jgi:hypothetical protein